MSYSKQVSARWRKEQQSELKAKGFYLVQGDKRTFISADVNVSAFERVCDEQMNDKTGYDYWIDYNLGVPDINGVWCWANMDQTDRFI